MFLRCLVVWVELSICREAVHHAIPNVASFSVLPYGLERGVIVKPVCVTAIMYYEESLVSRYGSLLDVTNRSIARLCCVELLVNVEVLQPFMDPV